MIKTIRLPAGPLSEDEAAALVGKPLGARHYDRVLRGEDVNVYQEDGSPLLVVRRRALPWAGCRPALRRAAKPSQNRGGVRSGVVGFFDRGRSCPYCRLTAFTRDDLEGWADLLLLLRDMDALYRGALPEVHGRQMRFVSVTHPDFVIPRTAFTTATVNNTVAFPAHRDDGNLHLGFSVMAVLRRGDFRGGLFVLPEYRLAVDLQDRDVALFESDAMHGNTPFAGVPGTYERLSAVAYFRAGMIECGSAKDEYERANRLLHR